MDASPQISAEAGRCGSDRRPAVGAVSLMARRNDRRAVSDAWCEALFASWLQPSGAPTAEMVAEAITVAVRRLGIRGCIGRMAQEFGDHPEAAAERMRWVRRLAAETGLAAA